MDLNRLWRATLSYIPACKRVDRKGGRSGGSRKDRKQSVLSFSRKKLRWLNSKQWFNLIIFFFAIYFFIIGIKLMGSGLKGSGSDLSKSLIRETSPFVGLAIGVFATAVIQSSSATTSMVVAWIATSDTPEEVFPFAIPIIIGANIGTSVTNVLVSMGHIRHPPSFRKAFSGALVHDFFNIISASIFFPLEWLIRELTGKGLLERMGYATAKFLTGTGGTEFHAMETILSPVLDPMKEGIDSTGFHPEIMMIIVGVIILFIALTVITKSARRSIDGKVQKVVDRVLFRSAPASFLTGMGLTSFVQSSSVTTSLVVPLIGGGILTIEQIFPYTLGANIGTTVTAMLAAMVIQDGSPAATYGLAIALVHLYFNILGIVFLYPLRKVPIYLAKRVARYISTNRKMAILFIVVVFFAIPGTIILLDSLIF
ncbi:MAG: Na/Pi symporter [Candidatus Thermoplasmatota archaeon]|nr:Na/Pi symporter [Candidatus Thermoplasmatota archaeon]